MKYVTMKYIAMRKIKKIMHQGKKINMGKIYILFFLWAFFVSNNLYSSSVKSHVIENRNRSILRIAKESIIKYFFILRSISIVYTVFFLLCFEKMLQNRYADVLASRKLFNVTQIFTGLFPLNVGGTRYLVDYLLDQIPFFCRARRAERSVIAQFVTISLSLIQDLLLQSSDLSPLVRMLYQKDTLPKHWFLTVAYVKYYTLFTILSNKRRVVYENWSKRALHYVRQDSKNAFLFSDDRIDLFKKAVQHKAINIIKKYRKINLLHDELFWYIIDEIEKSNMKIYEDQFKQEMQFILQRVLVRRNFFVGQNDTIDTRKLFSALNFAYDSLEERKNRMNSMFELYSNQMLINKYFRGDIFPIFFEMPSEHQYTELKELWIYFFHCLEDKIDILQQCIHGNNILHVFLEKIKSHHNENSEKYNTTKEMYKEMVQFLVLRNPGWLNQKNDKGKDPLEILLYKNDNQNLRCDLFKDLINIYPVEKDILKKYLLDLLRIGEELNITNVLKTIKNYYDKHDIDMLSIINENTGNTILHYIAKSQFYSSEYQKFEELIDYFITRKFDLNLKNKQNFTALDYASELNLKQVLKNNGAFTGDEDKFFSKLIYFSDEKDLIIKTKIIEKILNRVKQDAANNLSDLFDIIYPVEQRDAKNIHHINHLIDHFMTYHINYSNEFDGYLEKELEMARQCIFYFLPYSSYAEYKKNQQEKVQAQWLLKIMQKCSEIEGLDNDLNFQNSKNVQILLNTFIKKSLCCDLTECNEMGENIFHLISRMGNINYFNLIVSSQSQYPSANVYNALIAPINLKTGFDKKSSNVTPLKLAKEQYKALKNPEYNELTNLIDQAIKDLKPIQAPLLVLGDNHSNSDININ